MISAQDRSFAALCWTTTAILGCFLCLLQLGAMVSLMFGRIGFRLIGPFALIAALIVGLWLARKERVRTRQWWFPLAQALMIIAFSLAVSAFYYDLSWDGQWYHQTGIIHIASDWNPLAEPMRGFTKDMQEWVRHYPKGLGMTPQWSID